MAIDDQMDDDEVAEKKPKKKSNLLLIVLLVVMTLLLLTVSVAATLYFSGALNHEPAAASTEQSDGAAASDKKKKGEGKHAKKSKKAKKELGPPLYVKLGDPLVVNFVENNQIRYLQVQMEVMTRDPEMKDKIEAYMPLIRNNLLMMLSDLDYATISSFSGKQKIRAEALAEVQSIMKEQTGDNVVEELYFTSFVMQ